MRERKVLFCEQALQCCAVRGLVSRQNGRKIRKALHVIDEWQITCPRWLHSVVFVSKIVRRQKMLELQQIEAFYSVAGARFRKYILFCFSVSIKIYLLTANELKTFRDGQLRLGRFF